MSQFILENYTFNAAAKTISFDDLAAPRLEGLQLITHLASGAIIYQFNSASKGGSFAGKVLTLDYDTTGLSNGDKLQIIYNEPRTDDAAAAMQNLTDAVLVMASILANQQARVDVAGRTVVNNSEVTQPVSGTVTSNIGTGTLAAVTNLTQLSGQPVPYIGLDVPSHIYDNIKVT